MKLYIPLINILFVSLLFVGGAVQAGAKDDPLLSMFNINQLEIRESDESRPLIFEGQAWLGYDLNKLWLKADAERVDSDIEELEVQALYGKAIAPFWDLQLGIRSDIRPKPDRNWLVIGLQGLSPYYFEVDAAFFVDDEGDTAFRLELERELMLTQRWVLSPELKMNAYGQNDIDTATKAGLSDAEIGLRLRYEVRREIAPYIGINHIKQFGAVNNDSHTQWLVGVRAWF